MSQANKGPAPDRRTLIKFATIGLFAFQVAGCQKMLPPHEARRQGAALRILTTDEAARLEAFAEALVPGARAQGIAHFVDANLARPHSESLLTARYLDVMPPHDTFYRSGLDALDKAALKLTGKPFALASDAETRPLIASMLSGKVDGWDGPPPPLFYLAVRSDAADLVYGTVAAFERMNIPYMAHIEPPGDW